MAVEIAITQSPNAAVGEKADLSIIANLIANALSGEVGFEAPIEISYNKSVLKLSKPTRNRVTSERHPV